MSGLGSGPKATRLSCQAQRGAWRRVRGGCLWEVTLSGEPRGVLSVTRGSVQTQIPTLNSQQAPGAWELLVPTHTLRSKFLKLRRAAQELAATCGNVKAANSMK